MLAPLHPNPTMTIAPILESRKSFVDVF